MDPSPYARCTFWNMVLGTFFMHLYLHGTLPSSVQRSLCVPSLRAARRTMLYLSFGFSLCKALSVATGLIIYATYYYCDPLDPSIRVVQKSDQLVPYYVMDVASEWPGLSGLFVAGVFSAALSTMSAVLNTLSGTLYKDFIEKLLPKKVSDEQASTHMKYLSFAIGVFCVIMIFIVERLGGVLPVAISMGGITSGASFGLFVLGMFFPWVNHKGALAGAVFGLVFMAATIGGNSYSQATGQLYYPHLETRVDGCIPNSTFETADYVTSSTPIHMSSIPELRMPYDANVFFMFKISYFYYGLLGTVVTIISGLLVSFCTGPLSTEDSDPDLFSPVVACFLPKYKARKNQQEKMGTPMEEYRTIPTTDVLGSISPPPA